MVTRGWGWWGEFITFMSLRAAWGSTRVARRQRAGTRGRFRSLPFGVSTGKARLGRVNSQD